MSLKDNLHRFAARGAAQRLDTYGHDCLYQGYAFKATRTPIRDARTLRDGGFTLDADLSIRFSKSDLPVTPVAETLITVDGNDYRVAEIKDIDDPFPEWLMALHNLG